MVQDWIVKLPEKTGKSLEQWLRCIKKEGPPTEEKRREWLKKEHGMGTNTAWWLAERAEGRTSPEDSPESYLAHAPKYVDETYAGPKAALRPPHDQLVELAKSVAKDVKVCPCKTIVPHLPQACHRADQAGDVHAHRLRLCLGGYEAEGPAHRHRRLREEGSHHPPHSHHVHGRLRRRSGALAEGCLRPGTPDRFAHANEKAPGCPGARAL